MLNVSELTLWRGYRCLFEDLSFAIAPGEALLVRGPNGSGKTTLLRVVAGLSQPESGSVAWAGVPLPRSRADYGRSMAYCGHLTGLKSDLTVAQNLAFAARLAGLSQAGPPPDALDLDALMDLPVRYLSAGQQRRAALARLLMTPARLWLMDEPFANLDTAGRDYLEMRLLEHLDAGGLALVAVHQDLASPERYGSLLLGDRA